MPKTEFSRRIFEFACEWLHEQENRYDNGDPSMAAVGCIAWQAQCERAALLLEGKLREAFVEVETKLDEGEFYDE
jgi:hypothetical protein